MPSPKKIILKQFQNGPMDNFQYFIGDAATGEVAIVDPAWDVDLIRSLAEQNGYKIVNIFLTHGHPDHINGLGRLLATHDIPVYISKYEAPFLMPKCKNLNMVEKDEVLSVGGVKFETYRTPGHTPGCICFKHGDILIAGDAIFIDGCGRCDLPGGDAVLMYDSLYNVISKFPDSTLIFPGHDYGPKPYDTLGNQKKTNPYLTCSSREEFLRHRMGLIF